jgi:peptidoglycan hydrolase-like protein with peptidoglycan-binding domain
MTDHIKIRFGASPQRNNNGDDIVQLKQALESLNYYTPPKCGITPYPDKDIFSSILQFQKDMGLKQDSIVNPGGETERTLNREIKTSGNSPIVRCSVCGAPHGGVYGVICSNCVSKGLS